MVLAFVYSIYLRKQTKRHARLLPTLALPLAKGATVEKHESYTGNTVPEVLAS